MDKASNGWFLCLAVRSEALENRSKGKGMLEVPWLAVEIREWMIDPAA